MVFIITDKGGFIGQILHESATTTGVTRRAIQNSQESIAALARRYDVTPTTVAKCKKRQFVHDAQMEPKNPRSTVLTRQEEAMILAGLAQAHTLASGCLPLCLAGYNCAFNALIPSQMLATPRHQPSAGYGGDKAKKKKFKTYPIGYVHIDIAEVRTEQGKLQLFVAIDRTCQFAYAELHKGKSKTIAAQFLRNFIEAVAYEIHTVLTDNGIQFTNRKQDKYAFMPIFDRICHEHGIKHRLSKINHPWTNGQVERMNRTIKDATVKRYHYTSHKQLKEHLQTFLKAYNFAKRLKTLKGLTPYEEIIRWWQKEKHRFNINPIHHTMGLNS